MNRKGQQAAPVPMRLPHDFAKRKGKPKHDSCFVCRKKIWGLLSNDFECAVCGTSVHSKKCLQQGQLTMCPGPLDVTTAFHHESNTHLGRVHASHHKKGGNSTTSGASVGNVPDAAKRPVQTINVLTGHPQNPFQLFLALGGKIHIYDILPNHGKGKDLLSHVMALPGIPKAKIRQIQSGFIAPEVAILGAITTMGAFVYRLDRLEEAPLILGYGADMGSMAIKGQHLACSDFQRHVTIWDLNNEFAQKSGSTETIVLDEDAISMEFAEDFSTANIETGQPATRKLVVAGADGHLRVYRLGVMRGCVAEYEICAPNSRVAMRVFPGMTLLTDQQDTFRVINSSKLLSGSEGGGRVTSIAPNQFAAGGSVANAVIDKLSIAKQQFFRIPAPRPSYPNVFVEFADPLSLAFVANAQTGKVDLVKIFLNKESRILRQSGSVGDLDVILGMTVVVTEEFCYLYTFYANLEMYCYAININSYVQQTGVGASAYKIPAAKVVPPAPVPSPSPLPALDPPLVSDPLPVIQAPSPITANLSASMAMGYPEQQPSSTGSIRKSTSPDPMESSALATSLILQPDDNASKRRTRSASDASMRLSIFNLTHSPFDNLFDHLEPQHPLITETSLSPRYQLISSDALIVPSVEKDPTRKLSFELSKHSISTSELPDYLDSAAIRRSTSEPDRPDSIMQQALDLEEEFIKSSALEDPEPLRRGLHQKSYSEVTLGHSAISSPVYSRVDNALSPRVEFSVQPLTTPSMSAPNLFANSPAGTAKSPTPGEFGWKRTAANRTNLTNTHSFSMKQNPYTGPLPASQTSPPHSPGPISPRAHVHVDNSALSSQSPSQTTLSPPGSPRATNGDSSPGQWRFAKRG